MALKISVIVLAWNGEQHLDSCLSAVVGQDFSPVEVIVVDNASTDRSAAIAQKYAPQVRIIRNDYNLGYAAGNNVGLKVADGDIVVLLNQDTVVQPGFLSILADSFGDPTIGIVGCKALYPGGRRLAHAGAQVLPGNAFTYHTGWGEEDNGQYDILTDADYVTGAAFAVKRMTLDKLGGLEEQYYPAYYEEIDYCYRARRAGFRVVYQPQAVLIHTEATSLPTSTRQHWLAFHRNRVRFVMRQWDAEQLESFAVEERNAIENSQQLDDIIARAHAYLENLLTLPVVISQRRTDKTLGGPLSSGRFRWLTDTLHGLRQQAHQRVVTLLTMPPSPSESLDLNASASGIPAKGDALRLQALIQELRHQSVLVEPTLYSRLPILGWLVNFFRRNWISVIERHYLMPILNQQSAINARISELMRLQNESYEREIAMLQQDIAALQQEVATLRTRDDVAARLLQIQSTDDAAIPYVLQMIQSDHKPGSTNLCKVSEE